MSPIHLPEAGQRLTAVPQTGWLCHCAFARVMVVQGLIAICLCTCAMAGAFIEPRAIALGHLLHRTSVLYDFGGRVVIMRWLTLGHRARCRSDVPRPGDSCQF